MCIWIHITAWIRQEQINGEWGPNVDAARVETFKLKDCVIKLHCSARGYKIDYGYIAFWIQDRLWIYCILDTR